MKFDELPPKTSAYFLDKIGCDRYAITYFNECDKYGYNVIQAIKITMKFYGGNWAIYKEVILPKEIEEELFPYIFGQPDEKTPSIK